MGAYSSRFSENTLRSEERKSRSRVRAPRGSRRNEVNAKSATLNYFMLPFPSFDLSYLYVGQYLNDDDVAVLLSRFPTRQCLRIAHPSG